MAFTDFLDKVTGSAGKIIDLSNRNSASKRADEIKRLEAQAQVEKQKAAQEASKASIVSADTLKKVSLWVGIAAGSLSIIFLLFGGKKRRRA